MFHVIIKTVITFLMFYAVIDIGIKIFDSFFSSYNYRRDEIFVVVKVYNREKNLEYIIRSIIWKNLKCSKGGNVPNVLIVDMGCDEETSQIGKRLAEDYSFIYYTGKDEFDDFFSNFNRLE